MAYHLIDVDTGEVFIKNGDENLAPNFKVKEFACNDGNEVILFSKRLVSILQDLRNEISVPLHLNSAFRTKSYNVSIGGATHSFHMKGMALDLAIPKGFTNIEFYELCARFLGYQSGVIVYDNFVHIDIRDYHYRANKIKG